VWVGGKKYYWKTLDDLGRSEQGKRKIRRDWGLAVTKSKLKPAKNQHKRRFDQREKKHGARNCDREKGGRGTRYFFGCERNEERINKQTNTVNPSTQFLVKKRRAQKESL